jgi:hypothetical protein
MIAQAWKSTLVGKSSHHAASKSVRAWFEGRGCAIQVLAGLRAWIEAAGPAHWSSSLGTPLRIPMA